MLPHEAGHRSVGWYYAVRLLERTDESQERIAKLIRVWFIPRIRAVRTPMASISNGSRTTY